MYKTDKWELKHFEDDDSIEIIVREDDGRITNGFASIPCYGEDDCNYDDQWEIARLLVAAPALLAALKNLLENDLLKDEFHLAGRLAIAKAET